MENNIISIINTQKHSGPFTKLFSKSQSKTKLGRNGEKSNTMSNSNANHNNSRSTCSLLQMPNFQITTLTNQPKEKEQDQYIPHIQQRSVNDNYKSNKLLFGNKVLKAYSIKEIEKNHQKTIKLHKQQYEAFIYKSLFNKTKTHKITKLPVKAKLSSPRVMRHTNRYNSAYTDRYKKDQDIDGIEVNSLRSNSTSNNRELKRNEYVKNKIISLQAKVNLIQGITNLVYPQIIMQKIKEKTKHLYKPYINIRECTPSQRNDMLISENNLKMTDYYSKSITVFNKSHLMTSFK